MKSCKQMAVVWGVSERRVTEFCKEGMIPGAVKVGKRWQIPDDAKRPADKRIVTGRYIKTGAEKEKKPLPVGISDYIRAQSEYYYVDKTLLIKEFLDRNVCHFYYWEGAIVPEIAIRIGTLHASCHFGCVH